MNSVVHAKTGLRTLLACATLVFIASTATNTPPNSFESVALTPTSDMAALYHLDNSYADATGKQGALTPSGNVAFDPSNVGWLANRAGTSLHTLDLGDQAVVSIPNSALVSPDTQVISVEAMVYINNYMAYNRGNAKLVSLNQNWNASLEFNENIYYGPRFQCGTTVDVGDTTVTGPLTKNVWHHLRIALDKTGYTFKVDGNTVYSQASGDLANWSNNGGTTTLTLGNFDGWIDEVVVRNVRTTPPAVNLPPSASLTSPASGATYTAPASITLAATAADSDGTVSKVEFFQGSTKLGEAASAPYSFTWANVAAGTYSLTAKATDNAGATATSPAVSVTVKGSPTLQTVAAPVFSPAGGVFTNSVAVTLSSATAGSVIYYTTDGSAPTSTSKVYSGAITLTNSSTLTAKATAAGMVDTTTSASFTVKTAPTSTPIPAPWKNADIGAVGLAGSASYANGSWTVNGSGADIWGTADAFQFVYQPITGDGEIVVQVNSLGLTDPWAKAGVMFRETLDPGSRHAVTVVTASNGTAFQRRTTPGAASVHTAGALVAAPYWVKLVRAGTTLTGYASSDNVTWTQVGTDTVAMSNTIYVGLIVTAHNATLLNQSVFSNVTLHTNAVTPVSTALPAPWASTDIGAVGHAGSATYSNSTFTVNGSGVDIWNTVDGFQFVNQPWTGDGEIVARVASIQPTDPWAKAVVMFRDNLSANSPHAMTVLSSSSGCAFQFRPTPGAYTAQVTGAKVAAPSWLRLTRVGSLFTSYVSTDGNAWTQVASQSINMASSIYVGLGVTAHANTALNTSAFTNVRLSGGSTNGTGSTTGGTGSTGGTVPGSLPSPWTHQDVGTPTLPGNATFANSAFTVTGSGADIWNTADEFQFASQPWTGDGTIVACVTGIQNTDPWAKAGVMFRETLAANSTHASMLATVANGQAFQTRPTTGSASLTSWAGALNLPVWVKLTRSGNTFTSYGSTDGVNWNWTGAQTVPMAASIYVGLAVTAHTESALSAATFTNVQVAK